MNETATIGMGGALRSGTSIEWWTPPHIFDALGLEFDLDPCAPPEPAAPWLPVDQRYTKDNDGLLLPWHRHDRVWLNPPYGLEAPKWIDKLVKHGNGISLVFTRCDARWCQAALAAANAVCFIAGRLRFIDGTGQGRVKDAANSSMLLAYGPECAKAVVNCDLGVVLTQPISDYKSGEGR